MSALRDATRIARRELRGGLAGFRVFLACLALGVAAIAAVGMVRESIQQGLEREGATLLGGDAQMSFTYRFATEEERAWMAEAATAVSEIVDFRSMAVVDRPDGSADRALVQLKGVDGAWPLLGQAELDPAVSLDAAFAGADGMPGAVADPVLAARLGLSVGDRFRLGEASFVLSALLEREPDSGATGFAFGPRVLVRTADLDGSGLLTPGTLYESRYRLDLPAEADLDTVKAEAEALFRDTGMSWRDSRRAAPAIARFVDRTGAFLVLVGLAGLAVGGIGVSAAVRAYLEARIPTIAVLRSFGASSRVILWAYLMQIGALAGVGVVLGLVLGAALPLAVAPLLEARLPIPAAFGLHPGPLLEAALYGVLTALIFTLWPLARTETIRPAALFRDAGAAAGWPRRRWIATVLGLVVVLIGAAVWFSGVPELTLGAAAGVLGALLLLALAARGIAALSRRAARSRMMRGRSALRLAFGAIGGPGGETASVVLSLGLGLSVLAAVGQIDSNLRRAIAGDLPDVAPSFFVVDIQPDQMQPLQAALDAEPGVERVETAPMLRGVITRINGEVATDVAGNHWVLRGDRGVTYAATPDARTEVTAGTWWPEDYPGPPQISFAAEEAREIGLKLGDTLTVNILGRDIEAEVTSFREVDFSDAGIGFVLTMNPAAVQGAPHTFIATIYADADAEPAILRDVAGRWPNITMIRVRDVAERVAELLGAVATAITYGAGVTLLTGGIVLIGAAAAGERARVFEAAVLKTVGAARRQILAYFAWRSMLTGLAAGLVAVLAGGLAGWAVTVFVMETDFVFEPLSALLIIAGGVLATTLAGLGFALRPLAARPARVLRARD